MGYMFLYAAASSGNYSAFRYRTKDGGTAASNSSTAPRIPYWVRLVLRDGTLTGYQSADGQNWGAAPGAFIRLRAIRP